MAIWKWWSAKGRCDARSGADAGSGAERRAAPRYYNTRVTTCSMIKLPANIPVPAELRDISRTGLGLACHKPVEAGAFLVVNLAAPHNFSCTLQARVVHSTQQDKTTWLVGCLLRQELSAEELEAII